MWEGGGGGERSTQAVHLQHVRGGGGSQAPLPPLLSHHRLIASRLLWSPVNWCDRQSIDVIASQLMWSPVNCCDRQSIDVIASQLMWSPVDCCDCQSIDVIASQLMWSPVNWCDRQSIDVIASKLMWSPVNWCYRQSTVTALIALNAAGIASHRLWSQDNVYDCQQRLWLLINSTDRQSTAVIASQQQRSPIYGCDHQSRVVSCELVNRCDLCDQPPRSAKTELEIQMP
jgi:hypothetical protein